MERNHNNEGCSFCNGRSKIESTGGDNWGKIKLLKNDSILNVEIYSPCYTCYDDVSGYSEFKIKYCPMCGYEVSNFKNKNV